MNQQAKRKKHSSRFPAGKEKFIQWIWEKQLIKPSLLTEDSRGITIVSPGRLNLDDGPDFKSAVINLYSGGIKTQLEGDVEIHILSTDWYLHNHYRDPKYNNVILHIITKNLKDECITSAGIRIPVLDISKYTNQPIKRLFKKYNEEGKRNKAFTCKYKKNIPYEGLTDLIEVQGVARFKLRGQKFQSLIEQHGIEQALYLGIMESLGYVRNEEAFIKLATLANIERIKHLISGASPDNYVNIIKTALLGTAGLLTANLYPLWDKIKVNFPSIMAPQEWQLFKVRPQGFPANRINGISYFFADAIKGGIYNYLNNYNLNQIENIFQSKSPLLGKNCSRTIVLNVCLPFMSAIKQDAYATYKTFKPLPKNYITDYMRKILWAPAQNHNYEIYYQGLTHIYHNFCKSKQCNKCPANNSKTADQKSCNSRKDY